MIQNFLVNRYKKFDFKQRFMMLESMAEPQEKKYKISFVNSTFFLKSV